MAHSGQKLNTAAEQRRYRRYALHFPCFITSRAKGKTAKKLPIQVETRDISKGGLFFVTEAQWEPGASIECLIELPLQVFGGRRVAIRCRGKIVRVAPEAENRLGVGATIQSFQYVNLEKESSSASPTKGSPFISD